MREALRTSARLGLLAVLLLVQPAASGDLPPAPAGAPGEAEVESADPCAVGRALARLAVPDGPLRYPPPPSAVCLAAPAATAAGASPSDR